MRAALCFLIVLTAASLPLLADEIAKPNSHGALCVIHADNKLLLVKETLSNKLSLPGGAVNPGESSRLAAERETWEEAGIEVSAVRQIGATSSTHVYECVPTSMLTAFSTRHRLKGKPVPSWHAPHFAIEVSDALLIEPELVQPEQYRYPALWPKVKAWISKTHSYPVKYIDNAMSEASWWQQGELKLLSVATDSMIQGDRLTGWIDAINRILFSPILLCLPIIMVLASHNFASAVRLLFAQLVAALVCFIAMFVLSSPSPSQYVGMLTEQGMGYGLPALPLTLWATSWYSLTQLCDLDRRWHLINAVMMLFALTSLSLGYHAFIIDGFIGVGIGYAVAKLIWRQHPKYIGRYAWLFLSVFACVVCYRWYAIEVVQLLVVIMMVSLVMLLLPNWRLSPVSLPFWWGSLCVMPSVYLTLVLGPPSFSRLEWLAVQSLYLPLAALLAYLSIVIRYFFTTRAQGRPLSG